MRFGFQILLATTLFAAGFQGARAQAAQPDAASVPEALQCGQFGLRNAEYFRISSRAGSVVTADFNNDAIPDVAAMMPDTNSIAVALGDNQTGFAPARDFVVGVSPQEAVVGDFNRDGELDLAVTSLLDDFVTVLLGDGQGNFGSNVSYPVGGAPRGLKTTDFNRDGWLDLVVVNTEAPNLGLSVLLGGPDGMTPANPGTVPLSDYPKAVETADFNNDGNPDIITVAHTFSSGSTPATVRIFQGNGAGGFTETLTFPLGESYTVETADFNSDGFADFAVFGQPDIKVRVYLNNQSGGFNAPLEFSIAGVTSASLQSTLFTGDLNGDGIVDLALGGFFMLNDGSANFTVRPRSDVMSDRFVLADFNGDGIVDQASPFDISDFNSTPPYSTFAVAYGTGDARFVVPSYIEGVGGATQMLTGDFNNDGRDDIVAGSLASFGQIRIAFQNADGSFNLQSISPHGGVSNDFTIVAAADFNNDGNLDIATNIRWARTIVILTNNGSGQFTQSGVGLVSGGFSFNLEYFQPGDFNNDGYTDFITVSQQEYILVLNNGAGGGFTVQPYVSMGSGFQGTKRIVVGDFNNDGNKDFAVARTNGLYQFRGNGDGTFAQVNFYPMPLPVAMARGADVNNDNRTDIVVSTGGNFTIGGAGASVFIAGETGIFAQTNFTLSGGPGDILFGDLNNDSFRDFVVLNAPNNHLTVFNGNGTGSFAPQTPLLVTSSPTSGAFGNFNQDQKPDLALSGQFANGAVRLFYNATPLSPCLSVNNPSVAEGNGGTTNAQFTVSLSAASAATVTVAYRVVGRSAALNSDFSNQTGTLTFAPGTLTQTVNVPIVGDVKDEIDETFQLVLANPSGASLPDNIGVGTILDDDAAPSVAIGDVSMLEGTGAGATQMIFNLSLSAPTGRKAKVGYSFLNGTAQGGSDFSPSGGTVVFNADQSTQQIVVNVTTDAYVEPDETFRVKLAGPSNLTIADDEANATILNDDFGGTVQFSGATYTASEANDAAAITVTRTGGAAAGIVVTYSTANGTATADSDYLSSTGKIIFDAGETSKTFTVPVLDDAIDETPTETVNLTLGNISGGAVLGAQSSAVLNISDDDPPTSVTLANISVTEGNSGSPLAAFTVRLLAVSGLPVSVNFATANGTATEPADYSGVSGTVVFAPGETVKTVSVAIVGDTQVEPNETFFLNLSAPVNAVLQNTQATATIVNDDSTSRRSPVDFDGDGKTDVSIFRPSDGSWWYLRSTDAQFRVFSFGSPGDKIVPGDYTGDGKTDVAVFRPSDGFWYIQRSEDNSFFSFPFGTSGDLPIPADFDGDGKTDAAVFRPSSATWYILNSGGSGTSIVQFGSSEDKPVPADFDGDGKADIAIFRPSDGSWWYLRSSDLQFRVFRFGEGTDKPVPGDYTGDGKADLAVFRPSTGEWFFQRSENNSYYSFVWGQSGDLATPGDYDGDGIYDAGIFRPTTTTWYVNQTSAGVLITNFGANDDKPVPGAFVP